MKWTGESMFRTIGKGTQILIFENGYISGQPQKHLSVGDQIAIRMGPPDEQHLMATVLDRGTDEATIEFDGGKRVKITPLRSDEMDQTPTWSGGPSEVWVIRSAA
jgi:hypothetical protein